MTRLLGSAVDKLLLLFVCLFLCVFCLFRSFLTFCLFSVLASSVSRGSMFAGGKEEAQEEGQEISPKAGIDRRGLSYLYDGVSGSGQAKLSLPTSLLVSWSWSPGLLVSWSPGLLVPMSPSGPGPWSPGVLVCWCPSPAFCWSAGRLMPSSCPGLLVLGLVSWSFGLLVSWSLVSWSPGLLVSWPALLPETDPKPNYTHPKPTQNQPTNQP